MLDKNKSGPVALRPKGWPQPKGYSDGMSAQGRVVVTGGVVGWDEHGKFATGLAAQTKQTLQNIVAIVAEAGAEPRHIVRLTWYVTDIENYLGLQGEIGSAYREVMGKHFPAMAVVQVVRLVEKDALVEIEATAVLPE
ncbi:MAG: RidA family protein [Xanthobacteraceae bacterium]|nr:RidA family protein [Xanthobacteraceae bacterium]MBX3550571.1 RidA family protein [Xanthobacteraceae bacterium]MCW5679059.1 RidA family protein [Xanthobacteraceae bacterium]